MPEKAIFSFLKLQGCQFCMPWLL